MGNFAFMHFREHRRQMATKGKASDCQRRSRWQKSIGFDLLVIPLHADQLPESKAFEKDFAIGPRLAIPLPVAPFTLVAVLGAPERQGEIVGPTLLDQCSRKAGGIIGMMIDNGVLIIKS